MIYGKTGPVSYTKSLSNCFKTGEELQIVKMYFLYKFSDNWLLQKHFHWFPICLSLTYNKIAYVCSQAILFKNGFSYTYQHYSQPNFPFKILKGMFNIYTFNFFLGQQQSLFILTDMRNQKYFRSPTWASVYGLHPS